MTAEEWVQTVENEHQITPEKLGVPNWIEFQARRDDRFLAGDSVRQRGDVDAAAEHIAVRPDSTDKLPASVWTKPKASDSAPAESIDRLRTEIDDRKRHLARFNLAESTARRLDDELARAGDLAAQLAVLDRWLAGMERAHTVTEAIVAGRDAAAYERAMRPRPQERLLTIVPWLRRS
jgi:hypothetical protein